MHLRIGEYYLGGLSIELKLLFCAYCFITMESQEDDPFTPFVSKYLLPLPIQIMSKDNDPNWHLVYETFDPKQVRYALQYTFNIPHNLTSPKPARSFVRVGEWIVRNKRSSRGVMCRWDTLSSNIPCRCLQQIKYVQI